jgi:hypothetical protein
VRFRLLRCEARQMVVDPYARSAEPSRIVEWRLRICAAIVTQFVTHFGSTSALRASPRWQALEFQTPTAGVDAEPGNVRRT